MDDDGIHRGLVVIWGAAYGVWDMNICDGLE